MGLIDWTIVFGLLAFLIIMAHRTKKYADSVSNFLAAGRCAGKLYLVIDLPDRKGALSWYFNE